MAGPNYSKDNPPESCLECFWHGFTVSPSTGCHSYWSDYCKNLRTPFAKLHIILRGEYRSLSNHNETVLKDNLPFECPFFDSFRVFWEMYGRIKIDYEFFVFYCDTRGYDYYGYYVYSLSENIAYVSSEVSPNLNLKYITVSKQDESWFITTFGERSLMLSKESPWDWVYPVPSEPV